MTDDENTVTVQIRRCPKSSLSLQTGRHKPGYQVVRSDGATIGGTMDIGLYMSEVFKWAKGEIDPEATLDKYQAESQ